MTQYKVILTRIEKLNLKAGNDSHWKYSVKSQTEFHFYKNIILHNTIFVNDYLEICNEFEFFKFFLFHLIFDLKNFLHFLFIMLYYAKISPRPPMVFFKIFKFLFKGRVYFQKYNILSNYLKKYVYLITFSSVSNSLWHTEATLHFL